MILFRPLEDREVPTATEDLRLEDLLILPDVDPHLEERIGETRLRNRGATIRQTDHRFSKKLHSESRSWDKI